MLKFGVTRPVTNVVVFGCGGTGSRATQLVTQLLSSHEFTKNVKVILVDGDVVEEKNTKRQLFIPAEVGKNKAQVLARRYNLGFGAKTAAVPYFIPSVEHQTLALPYQMSSTSRGRVTNEHAREAMDFYDTFIRAVADQEATGDEKSWLAEQAKVTALQRFFSNTTVFISCVDSADARRRILQFVHNLSIMAGASSEDLANTIIIDSGNEDLFGQVSYFSPMQVSLCPFDDLVGEVPDKGPFGIRIPFVPMPLHKYMTMVDAETRRSCADMDQTLAVNNMMASLIMLVFQNLVYGLEMDFHTIYANMNGTFSTDRMTLKWMKGVMSHDQAYLRGIVDNLPIPNARGYVPRLSTMKGHWHNKDDKGEDKFLNSFFGIVPITDTMKMREYVVCSVPDKGTCFVHSPLKEMASSSLQFSTRTKLDHSKAREHFMSWIYTSGTHCSWKEILWPIIAKGLSSGYLKVTDLIRNYAYLTASTSSSVLPLEYTNLRRTEIPLSTLEKVMDIPNIKARDYLVEKLFFTSRTPYGVGDLTISDEAMKETFLKDMVLYLNLEDSLTGEAIKVTLPSIAGNLVAANSVIIRTHRVNENGAGTPNEETSWYGDISNIISFAIMSSMDETEIEDCRKWLLEKSNKNADLVIRSTRSIMASARGYLVAGLGTTGTDLMLDETSWKQVRVNAHAKHGNLPILVSEYPTGVRWSSAKEGDMLTFGKTVATSDLCISTSGRVYESDELKTIGKVIKEKGAINTLIAEKTKKSA